MYSGVLRADDYKARLLEFLRHEYGIQGAAAVPAKRGFFGETWRVDASGRAFFIKVVYAAAHKPIYERSFCVIDHIWSNGVTSISRIRKTLSGQLYTLFDSAILGVFEWIDGENVQNERTKAHEYRILGSVYAVPTGGITIAGDSFGTASANLFMRQWDRLKAEYSHEASLRVLAVLDENRERIRRRAERLALFAELCSKDMSHFYITHGDAGGNVIVNGDNYYIVDWDDPRLAPPERDAWFCLYWEWAMNEFNGVLRQNGIDYTLRRERLAYYCYHSFFHYLTEYMQAYFELSSRDMAGSLSAYFNCWIEEAIRYADQL